ncbi:MAG: hypothetical protein JXA99_13695 [Candidatus Lokiarchaeota archaeon]|nr:hypothetical protein [Candidatus Lokiarchaeota archaeon]
MFVITLDLKDLGCHAYIFDNTGSIISHDFQKWDSYSPSPLYIEQDPNQWWNSIKIAIENTIKKSGIDTTQIVSISFANERDIIVPVDKAGNSLYNAIVSADRRACKEIDYINEKIGIDQIYKVTGLNTELCFSLANILWIKKNKPNIYNETHKFLLFSDFIINKLTGKFITDFSNASRTMLFNINNLRYSDEIANDLDLDLDKMPEPVESGLDIGEITTNETTLDKKTLVITGAGDQQAAALGVGVIHPGDIKLTTGKKSYLLAHLDEPIFDPRKRVLCSCHAIPGAWVQEAIVPSTGSVLRWFRNEFGAYNIYEIKDNYEEQEDPYDKMTALAEESTIGADGLLLIPHFEGSIGPYRNPHSKGVIFGFNLNHTIKDVYRAILEGVAFEIRKNIEIFKKIGIIPKGLKLSGGASRSNLWNQITADIINITCSRNIIEEASPLGAAILGFSGAGVFKDITESAQSLNKIDKKYIPDEKKNNFYNQLYEFSLDLYNSINENNLYQKFDEIKTINE